MRTQTFRIEVWPRSSAAANAANPHSPSITAHTGIAGLTSCRTARLIFLQGALSTEDVRHLASELLADPVLETPTIAEIDEHGHVLSASGTPTAAADHTIDVTLLPGVTDPPAENLLRAAALLGIDGLARAATGAHYALSGQLSPADLTRLARQVFSNPVIQQAAVDAPIAPPFVEPASADAAVVVIPLRDADDETLRNVSVTRRLALDLTEMRAVRDAFRSEGRDPTDAELETLAQVWSEHCVHKTFRAEITYEGPPPGPDASAPAVQQRIDGLLKTYIAAATREVAKPWVRSAFVDNAGIIAFDDTWDLAFKVETHNHPSALEPFGGANTGVGGVVRDVLGVSARPIANTDILCFGPPDLPPSELPEGVLHPRRIADGVVAGIEDYGNKMGIPTVNGAILYRPGYTANPLVFCGCLGILPHGSHVTGARPGDLIVLLGGRTGRDGLGGATFSSMEMTAETGEIAGGAVQIGHPIHEKQVQEVILRARDARLYSAITDCGAGGISSAVSEMGSEVGAEVQLDTVPLKYPGLRPWEIWLSEAQERMVLAVPPEHWEALRTICAGQDVEVVSIGRFEAGGRLRLRYGESFVADLSMELLHHGLPRKHLRALWAPSLQRGPATTSGREASAADALMALLAHPDIRSKEDVIRRYDHEVQGGTAVKPLVGADEHGPGDATVLVPFDTAAQGTKDDAEHPRGAALAVGVCPAYGEIDPYAMAWAAVDEAVRNAVAVGADPDEIALLDNFCWGNTSLPDRLGSLVRCAQGCYDAAIAYGAPFISGKDSLNNEYATGDGERTAIPGTLVISALGIVPSVDRSVTMDLKAPRNALFVVGETRDELGGSAYGEQFGGVSERVPRPVAHPLERYRALHQAMRAGLVQSCHDCSEGGLAVALAEMCLAGRLGADVALANLPGATSDLTDKAALFSETQGRLIVEVRPDDGAAFSRLLQGVPHAVIGTVRDDAQLRVLGHDGSEVMHASVADLEAAWRGQVPQRVDAVSAERPTAASPVIRPDHSSRVGPKRVLILHANGTNRDRDAARACELAGAEPEVVHVNQLLAGARRLSDYAMLVIPGGFSYGDDLGAGTLWAFDLRHRLRAEVERFIAEGRPVLGICNGFQTLVKSGLLPGGEICPAGTRAVTLAPNASGQFECRWVHLRPNPASPSLFTEGLDELIYCPVAHGEGRLATSSPEVTAALHAGGLVALTYTDGAGNPTGYPGNPNGSVDSIAGICNPAGTVLGLMPHPEDHIFPWNAPRWHRGERGMLGLPLFQNGVRHA